MEGVVSKEARNEELQNSNHPEENTEKPKVETPEKCDNDNITVNLKENTDEPVNRTRRAYYIFAVTAFCLLSASTFVGMGYESRISEHFALRLIDLVEILSIIYVSAGVLDRSNFLSKIGEAISNRRRGVRND